MAPNGKDIVKESHANNSAIIMAYSQDVGFAYGLSNLCITLRKAGWNIVAFGPQKEQVPGLINKLREENIDIEFFDTSKPYRNLVSEVEDSQILRQYVLRNGPKTILCNGFRQGLTAFIACFGLKNRPKILLTYHSSYYFESFQGRFMILLSVLMLDRIICLNGKSRDFVARLPFGRVKVEQVPNGLDYPLFDHLAESAALPENVIKQFENLDPKRPRIVFSAFMLLEKGHDDLLLAHKRIIDDGMKPVLVFIGNGPRFEEITAKIEELGLQDSVLVLGKLDHNIVPKIFPLLIWNNLHITSWNMGRPAYRSWRRMSGPRV
jgi:glycosyltransferase involved in cell wall biosynthesis